MISMISDKIKITDIIKTYGPLLISAVALIISIRSCDIANNSINMNKEEFEKRREARLFVGAKWTGDKIYVSRYFKGHKIESLVHEDLYEGLEGFIILNVTNTSDHTISIDGIKVAYGVGYGLKSAGMSIPWGGTFKSVDMQNDIDFPIVLNPYEPFRCITRVPIPISARLVGMMDDLQSDTIYSSIDIIRELLYYLNKTKGDLLSPDSKRAIIKNKLVDLANNNGFVRYVPELLIAYTNPDLKIFKVSRGERAIEVEVKLSSGELIVQVLDYIDICRSLFDRISPQG